MRKWILTACATASLSLAGFVSYKLLACPKKKLDPNNFHWNHSNIDIEEILDDDVLDYMDGESGNAMVNSDDELDSIVEEDTSYGQHKEKQHITAKDSATLKTLAKKIRANKEKLVVNELPSSKMLKSWLGQEKENYEGIEQPKHSRKALHGKRNKDAVFYNLFACYAETATQGK